MHIKQHLTVYKGLPRDVYALFFSNVISRMGSFIMPLMTLILVEKIGLSKADAGLFTTVSMLLQAPFIMLGGRLADKLGGKRVIALFNSLGALVYLICGFLDTGMPVAVLLVIASILYAVAYPAFNCIVTQVTPREKLKSAFSLTYLGINLGFAVGPIISGLLFYKNLNLLFFLNGLTSLLSVASILLWVRPSARPESAPQCGETEAETAAQGKSVFSFLYRNPMLILFALGLLVYNFCYVQWNYLLPLQMVDLFATDGARLYSAVVSANAVTCIVLTPTLTSVTQRMHPLKTVYMGGFFYFASFLAFGAARTFVHFLLSVILLTVGEILISINRNAYVAHRTPQIYIGRVNSMLFLVHDLGSAIGPGVMGAVLAAVGFPSVWLVVAAVMLFGALGMALLKRADRESVPKASLEAPANE
ncbi:MAG TPA: MFS transporter [Feifaniaceae bacterium]|nr:MFS transporter [Feifaniaceae bacterium]